MPCNVSIVVPTYAPGDRIDGLVRSLDAQTMPSANFEVIFVDDGSPDDTWSRLERIRDSHDNVRIERIENSGWPSRPRNVGLELAQGEYVLFMDHDDELYPRALEAGFAMASRTQADVLNGKETRTDQSSWAIEVYERNLDNAIDRKDVHPLIPTNPHKLFRRALLMEHGIRFPEGGRVLWEDVFFALDIAPHAKTIAVLADTPFYHWVRGRTTASSSYTTDWREYWRWVREIVRQTNDKLAAPGLEDQWRLMQAHQYRSRVLARLDPLFTAAPDDFETLRATVEDIVTNHIPSVLDAELTPVQLGRAALIRAGRWDLLERLVAVDAGRVGISTATAVRWEDGVLRIRAESRWTSAGNQPLALRFDGDRVVRDLPADIAAALPPEALDVTAALHSARTSMGIRARDTGVTWMLPGECTPRVDNVDGRPELRVTATAALDPGTAVFGRPLDEKSWDITARNELFGGINQRGLRTSTPGRSLIRDGHVYIAYQNKSGMLSLDVDETNRSLPGSAPLDPKRAVVTVQNAAGSRWGLGRRTWSADFRIPFDGAEAVDDTIIDGSVSVGNGSARPARIEARPDGVWLVSTLTERSGTRPMTLHFHGRDLDPKIDVVVSSSGAVTLARRA